MNPSFVIGEPQSPPWSILIAEDNPDSRDALRSLLEAYGFQVSEARDGAEAVELAIALRPDIILMDIMMPVKDGFHATQILRGLPEFRRTPIVALTAMAGAKDRAIEAGCNACLPKPIDIPVLLRTIRECLAASEHSV